MTARSRYVYEFGPFRLDAASRRLFRDGQPVPLTPKTFDVLLTLVANNGELVEKDQLMQMLWPHTFVEEGNLTQQISQLRRALGDSPDEHRFIATAPSRGYRFVAEVTCHREDPDRPPQGQQPSGSNEDTEQSLDETDAATLRAMSLGEHVRTKVVVEEEYSDSAGQDPEYVEASAELGQPLALPSATATPSFRSLTAKLLMAGATLIIGVVAVLIVLRNWQKPDSQDSSALRSMAILPFKVVGPETGNEYLGLGLADTLINRLGRTQRIIVRPTSSVLKYTAAQDPLAAGRALGVDFVLDGVIQKSGERLRVTTELVNIKDGTPLWMAKFDERFTDIFAVEDSISEQVAGALTLRLMGKEKQAMSRRGTENVEAYQQYLKGYYFWNKRTRESFAKAIECFQEAVRLDPSYALAYVGLADAYGFGGPAEQSYVMLQKALQLDDTLGEAHASLACHKLFGDWNRNEAEREFNRALELNPNYPTTRHWHAFYFAVMGNLDEALAEIRRAQQLDPLSLIINTDVGQILFFARRYDDAIEQCRKTLEMDPRYHMALWHRGEAEEMTGMHQEAIRDFQDVTVLDPTNTNAVAALGHSYALSGQKTEALRVLDNLEKLSRKKQVAAYYRALVYVALGEKDLAFQMLDEAYEGREPEMMFLALEPKLDPLRSDVRFAALMQRVGLQR